MKFVYTVWFKSSNLNENDPDSTWPACFIIEGKCAKSAQDWGDSISSEYAKRNGEQFVNSVIESTDLSTLPGLDSLPIITEGTQPEDSEIGW